MTILLPLSRTQTNANAVLAQLEQAAAVAAPCPTNRDLGCTIGIRAERAADLMRALEADGRIVVDRVLADRSVRLVKKRRVTIAATGQSTGWTDLIGSRPADRPTEGLSRLNGAEALAARIDADQARLRAEREAWLTAEQQRYDLPKRGRLPEDMAA